MKYKIGVMGSSQGPAIARKRNTEKAVALGRAIARKKCVLVNGSCPGLPNDAAIGAKIEGGFVLGVSPAFSAEEHVHKYKSPLDSYDIILYTGMGLMERDVLNIRSSDAIVFIGGGIGTLNEFTVAFDEGKYIGILTGTDGISNYIPEIVEMCHRELGDHVIFDDDPEKLVSRLLKMLSSEKKRPVLEDQRVIADFVCRVRK